MNHENSLFSRLPCLREEDFLTVTFGYLLQEDKQLKTDYLRLLGLPKPDRCEIRIHRQYGTAFEDRPDMEISGPDTIAFQENKIHSLESRNQLKRYAKRLSNRPEKHKLLIYMSKRFPEDRLIEIGSGIPFLKFKRWEEIASLLKPTAAVRGRNRWLRQEIYSFLEDRDMAEPKPLNLSRINRYWLSFEPQRVALTRIIDNAARNIEERLDPRQFRCATDSTGLGLYICPTKGKIAKEFNGNNGYIWICGGVYFDREDKELCGYFGIGWVRNYTNHIPKTATTLLKSKAFNHEDDKYDEWYRYASFSKILRRSITFESQSSALAKWILTYTPVVLKSLGHIRNVW